MSTQYSAQRKQVDYDQGHKLLKPNELHGRVRVQYFEFNTTDDIVTALAEDDVIILGKLPKGARILRGFAAFEAMGTDMIAKIGLKAVDGSGYLSEDNTTQADDAKFFTDSQSDDGIPVAAAGTDTFADTLADHYGYELEKECYLIATLGDTGGTDPWAANKNFNGHIEYVVD